MQSDSEQLSMMQTRWAAVLNNFMANPSLTGTVLKQVSLSSGSNVINHKLGRKLQGWFITRIRAASNLYDTQDTNIMPELTLQLEASADAIVDIYVF